MAINPLGWLGTNPKIPVTIVVIPTIVEQRPMREKPTAKKGQPLILNVDPGTLLLIVALSLLLPLLFVGFTAH